MPQVIIFENENGNVSVCVPTGELPIEAVKAKDCPKGAIIVDSSELPEADNDFFNSWELDYLGKVSVNIDKAKGITKDRLRAEREPLLKELDVKFQRAMEDGSDTQHIVKEKNRLRDVTKLVDGCKNTAELRALTCEEVK